MKRKRLRKKVTELDSKDRKVNADILECMICQEPSVHHLQYSSCPHTICVICNNNWERCSWEAHMGMSPRASIQVVDLYKNPMLCPLCKVSERDGTVTKLGMAPLMMYNMLEEMYPQGEKKEEENNAASLSRMTACPYCSTDLSANNLYRSTLHLFTCGQRKVTCPKCEEQIVMGKDEEEVILRLKHHLETDCTHLIRCPFCPASGVVDVPVCGYAQHVQESHFGDNTAFF